MEVVLVQLPSGSYPVKEFLAGIQDAKAVKKILRNLELFEKYGFQKLKADKDYKKMASVKKVNLWEFRNIFNNKIYRILFTMESNKAYLLHGFMKKSRKTPAREIQTAISRIVYIS